MKKSASLFVVLVVTLIVFFPAPVQPCTSFADYSAEPVYGLNFDSLDHNLRFMFYKGNGFDLLAFEFFQDDVWGRMAHFTTQGMHNAGLLLYPNRITIPKQAETDEHSMTTAAWMYELDSIDEFRDRINNTRFYDGVPRSHHALYGPEYGLFFEPAQNGNYIQQSDPGGYLVLTNFEMSKFHGQPPEKVYGVGDSRYRAAHRSIKAIRESGTMNGAAAMSVLRDARADAGDMKTRCSMVFLPEEQTLTLTFDRNFEKKFIISLRDRTVTANWPGANPAPAKIGKKGVYKEDLLTWTNDDPSDDWKGSQDFPLALVLLLAGAGSIALLVKMKLHRRIQRKAL